MELTNSWGNSELTLELILFLLFTNMTNTFPPEIYLLFSHEQLLQIMKLELAWTVSILSLKEEASLSPRDEKEEYSFSFIYSASIMHYGRNIKPLHLYFSLKIATFELSRFITSWKEIIVRRNKNNLDCCTKMPI